MSKRSRLGSSVTAAALLSLLAGCAVSQAHLATQTHFGGKADEDVGVATTALMALSAHNLPQAIALGERAVAKNPDDAGFRALLGNAYFECGRFWSAESAYKDSLTIYSNQPAVVLKLALTLTALGKKDEAAAFLNAARHVLPASDYGLALALAGHTEEAVQVLEAAARDRGADATVRQNLALAYGLSGDWTKARVVAGQDVIADKLDARIQQWMQLAHPAKAADQVAALVGVTPAASDQGQPVQLALRKEDKDVVRVAQAAPMAAPKAAVLPAPVLAAVAPPTASLPLPPVPRFVEAVAAPAPAPTPVQAVAPAPPPADPKRKAAIAEAAAPSPAPMTLAMMAAAAPEAASAFAAFMPHKPAAVARPRPKPAAAPSPRRGNSSTVVQLGAYRSPQVVSAAWYTLARRYPALRAYLPMRARFDSPKGTFWRLSIQGFGNQREAVARCQLLRSQGGNCFVRVSAGDAPVQMAMR